VKSPTNRILKSRNKKTSSAQAQRPFVFQDASAPPRAALAASNSGDRKEPFLDMEYSVSQAAALLRILSESLAARWRLVGGEFSESQGIGIQEIADRCARSLVAQWNGAHYDMKSLQKGRPIQSGAADRLVLTVEQTATLLELLAEHIAEYVSSEVELANPGTKEVAAVIGQRGFSRLAQAVIKPLKSQFDAAFIAWQELERDAKRPAAASAPAGSVS
jgi:hypothetical protein